jgi:hypothetical protein
LNQLLTPIKSMSFDPVPLPRSDDSARIGIQKNPAPKMAAALRASHRNLNSLREVAHHPRIRLITPFLRPLSPWGFSSLDHGLPHPAAWQHCPILEESHRVPRPRWNNLSANTPVTIIHSYHILPGPDLRYEWPDPSEQRLRELLAKGGRAGEGPQR